MSLRSPWIYRPSSRGEHQNTVYLREGWNQKVTLTPRVKSEEEKTYEWAKRFGKDVTAGIGAIAPVGRIMAFILAWTSNFLGSLIRVFNVANVVTNIGKIDIKLATNVNATFTFVDNIKIPEWKFLAGASPLEDYEWGERDRDAHQRLLRGTRGKITINNERVFLGSGQSFIISLTILLLRLAVIPVLDCFMNKSNVFLRVVCFTYQLILGVFFYQYQIICVAEIAMMDYERIPDPQFRAGFFGSLLLSIAVLILMMVEIFNLFWVVQKIKGVKVNINDEKANARDHMSMNKKFALDRLTRVLNLDESSNQSYYKMPVLETLRFFIIQILIATLQLLNKTQAVLVFLVNLAYFVYFFRALLTAKVYKNLFLFVKAIVLEVCLMMLITTMLVFAFAEDTDFQDSWVHKVLEQGAIMGILGAVGAELVNMLVEFYLQVAVICRK